MLTIELLRNYKQQNPGKYLKKYGDRSPEEVFADPKVNKFAPVFVNSVKVEIQEKKDKEMEFKDPISGFSSIEELKPKRGRKKVADV